MADVVCEKCGGPVYDNRGNKTNPRSPDLKCKDSSCGWKKWPAKLGGGAKAEPKPVVPLADISKEYLATVLWFAKQLAKVDATELPTKPTFADAQASAATAYINFRRQF